MVAAAAAVALFPTAMALGVTNVIFDTSKTIVAGDTSMQVGQQDLSMANSNTNLTLNVQQGGLVDALDMYLALGTGKTLNITVDGPGSLMSTHDTGGDVTGNMDVGERGTATLMLKNGASIHTWRAWAGYFSTATGTITVDGPSTVWQNDYHFYVGAHGVGYMYIQNSGTVNTFRARVGEFPSSTGTVNIIGTGASWNIGDQLSMGSGTAAHGTINVNQGAYLANSEGVIGNLLGGFGTVNVDGTGTRWNNTVQLHVGQDGTGLASITNGARTDSGFSTIGRYGAGIGTINVDGAGTLFNSVGAFNDVLGPALNVGYWGTGTLNVTNGARVQSKHGAIGTGFGSDPGTAIITSGVGTATIDGANSIWHNDLTLTIGLGTVDPNHKTITAPASRGSGTLNITNGGRVENTDAILAAVANTTGRATLSGANSIWASSGSMYIGGQSSGAGGTAFVTVNTGASVQVTSTSKIYSGGTLTLGGGTYSSAGLTNQAGKITGYGTISGPVTNAAGGRITVTGGTLALTGLLSNSGLVDLASHGTLLMSKVAGFNSATVLAQLAAGYHGGRWDATTGISASQALLDPTGAATIGYVEDATTFREMYTLYGDVNLDGLVNSLDLTQMQSFPDGQPSYTWAQGDLNYDGKRTADDYALFSLGLAATQTGHAPVPEPACGGLIFAGLFGSIACRRSRR